MSTSQPWAMLWNAFGVHSNRESLTCRTPNFRMLLFKKKFMDAIRRREKTQTVRLWKFRKMRPGQRSYIPGAGYIAITAVDAVALAALTDDDARLDGFDSADALRREIDLLYPKQLAQGYQAFRIRFDLLPPEEQQRMRAEKAAKKVAGRPKV